MDFNSLEDIEKLVLSLTRMSEEDIGRFEPINILNFKINLNAGEFCYCEPRKNLNSLKDYNYIEVEICEISREGNLILLSPNDDNRFSHFNWIKYFNYGNDRPSYIGNNVPLNVVFQIIKDINRITKLQTFF
jgi:hypothetical protein